MNKKKYIIYALVMITIALVLIFVGEKINTKQYSNELITKTAFYLDTFVSVQVYDCEENYNANISDTDALTKLVESAVKLCGEYELVFSKTNAESELYKFNNSSKKDIEISPELYDVIDKSLHYSKLSDGKFDITVSKLADIWNFKNEIVPDATTINNCLSAIDYDSIKLYKKNDKNYLTLDSEAQLDLGGIAKGYIADKIKKYLTDNGIKSGIINLGGNMIAIGKKPDGTNYNIGIQKPFSNNGELICTVSITDKSVVTSGIYERMFEKEGKQYHHIIDPDSGYPAETGIYSATIIADESVDADALSTVCVLLGKDKALKLINSLEDIECVLVNDSYEVIYSDGLTYENNIVRVISK